MVRLVGMSPNHLCTYLSGVRNAWLTKGLNLGWHTQIAPRVWGRMTPLKPAWRLSKLGRWPKNLRSGHRVGPAYLA